MSFTFQDEALLARNKIAAISTRLEIRPVISAAPTKRSRARTPLRPIAGKRSGEEFAGAWKVADMGFSKEKVSMAPLHPSTLTVSAAVAAKTLMNHGKVMAMRENRARRPPLRL